MNKCDNPKCKKFVDQHEAYTNGNHRYCGIPCGEEHLTAIRGKPYGHPAIKNLVWNLKEPK
jgi:hypothetical protein|tara:strand:+ start:308 stop:490 length:183 start_codon:yes stop_codon:yes gene_type:complete